jgi:hypothetical protein
MEKHLGLGYFLSWSGLLGSMNLPPEAVTRMPWIWYGAVVNSDEL